MTPLSSLLWSSYRKPALVCQKRKGEEKQKMWNQGYMRYKITNKGQVWKGGSQRRAAWVDFPAAHWFRPDSWFHLKVSMYSFLVSSKWKGKLHIYNMKCEGAQLIETKAHHKYGLRTTPQCTYKKTKPIWKKKCSCHLYLKQLIACKFTHKDITSQGTCYVMFTRSRQKLVFCFLQAAILPQGAAEHGEARCARRASPPVRATPLHTVQRNLWKRYKNRAWRETTAAPNCPSWISEATPCCLKGCPKSPFLHPLRLAQPGQAEGATIIL